MALQWPMAKDLKEIANETTYSNNEDGIGRYLNDF